MQFGRKTKRDASDMPAYGGSKGPDISKNIQEVVNAFEKLIHQLQNLNYDILDVKVTRWHEDYNVFKRSVKDLEVMMRNVINGAFETVSTVPSGVELVESFVHLSKRETIKRTLDKKTSDLYSMFILVSCNG
jgi:dynein heavy chain